MFKICLNNNNLGIFVQIKIYTLANLNLNVFMLSKLATFIYI